MDFFDGKHFINTTVMVIIDTQINVIIINLKYLEYFLGIFSLFISLIVFSFLFLGAVLLFLLYIEIGKLILLFKSFTLIEFLDEDGISIFMFEKNKYKLWFDKKLKKI